MKNYIALYILCTAAISTPYAYADHEWNRPNFNPDRYGSPHPGEDRRDFTIRIQRELKNQEEANQQNQHQGQQTAYRKETADRNLLIQGAVTLGAIILAWFGYQYLENANKKEEAIEATSTEGNPSTAPADSATSTEAAPSESPQSSQK